jgi:hypothetical protein
MKSQVDPPPLLLDPVEWPSSNLPEDRVEGGRVLRSSDLPLAKLRWRAVAVRRVTPLYSDLRVAYFPPWGCLLSGWGHHPPDRDRSLILGGVPPHGEDPFQREHRLLPGFHARFHGPPELNAWKPEALLEAAASRWDSDANMRMEPGFRSWSLAEEGLVPAPVLALAARLGGREGGREGGGSKEEGFDQNIRRGWWVPEREWDWLEAPWKDAYLRDWYAESAALAWGSVSSVAGGFPLNFTEETAFMRANLDDWGMWHPGAPPWFGPPFGRGRGPNLPEGELYPRAHPSRYLGPLEDPGRGRAFQAGLARITPEELLWEAANRNLRRSCPLTTAKGTAKGAAKGVDLGLLEVIRPSIVTMGDLPVEDGSCGIIHFNPSKWPTFEGLESDPGLGGWHLRRDLLDRIAHSSSAPFSIKEFPSGGAGVGGRGRGGPQDIRTHRGPYPLLRDGTGETLRLGELPMYLSHEMEGWWG